MSIAEVWGTSRREIEMSYPCDVHCPPPSEALYRGVSITADPAVVFRWLCQMRVAPYSYDWLDNLGRRSPQGLTPGLDDLAVGQTFMMIFTLVEFDKERHVTLMVKPRFAIGKLGKVALSYVVIPDPPHGSRVLVKIVAPPTRGPARLVWHLIAWVDLIMMRRQLLNFKRLAEG